ncbi:M15 family metallopeptidase [Amycolatopsis sp. Hca4]|uniref:M15 family metallopeptidase n=1 Tax=Amycolatopsis sp. Hca4 TaxID=2742131 RepID=UPI0034CD3F2E
MTNAPSTTAVPEKTSSAPAVTWQVGARPLPRRPDGFGEVEPTPPELVNRALPTKDLLPPPVGTAYASTISAVPADVLARSTWQPACPVKATDLRYLTMSFWGFDGRAHTGEMLVNTSAATAITQVFGQLFAARFPLEEMRVTAPAELTAPPTGDGNSTSAFVCRPARGQTTWSVHAYGLAVDVNPFCNPYTQGGLVLPELASAYVDRARRRPGMVLAGDATVRAFAAIGWSWGGNWRSPTDRMHFTATGH